MATLTEEEQLDYVDGAFCDSPPESDCEDIDAGSASISGEAHAVVSPSVVWSGRQVLKVLFMNPDLLGEWGLTPETILEWANGTDDCVGWSEVMEFKETKKLKKADIRIEFTKTKGSWSMVGMKAEKVKDHAKPTMMLNLTTSKDGFIRNEEDQRSLVIHEFGHALGLEHEHQRSDFWDGVEKHLDMDKMRQDKRVERRLSKEGKASFGMDWFKDKKSQGSVFKRIFSRKGDTSEDIASKYDSDSIMHYGFDVKWIKDERHRIPEKIKTASYLTDQEKECLKGIHKRSEGLARQPSDTDIEILKKAYNP